MHPMFKGFGGRGGRSVFGALSERRGGRGGDAGEGDLGGRGGRGGRGGGGGGGRRERMFESGDLKLLLLSILAQQPSHGYDLIRAIGEQVGGDYTPSPGTIYPTLSLLEDMGLVSSATQDGGRKQYTITAEGQAHLAQQQGALEQVQSRLQQLRSKAQARRSPEIQRAMENLKTALRLRLPDDGLSEETARRVAEILDRAAVDIGRV